MMNLILPALVIVARVRDSRGRGVGDPSRSASSILYSARWRRADNASSTHRASGHRRDGPPAAQPTNHPRTLSMGAKC